MTPPFTGVPVYFVFSKVGRRKYLLPIYKALASNPEDKLWAKKVFDNSKAYYHAVSRNSIAKLFTN